ncbi:MAG: TIM barrel protein [Lachnospiraceae bacterium]
MEEIMEEHNKMFHEFAFSTTWNAHRVASGKEMIEEILGLGFHRLELNYKVTKEMLQDVIPYLERGEVQVDSVHNVFPKVEGKVFGPDSLLLSYEDQELRDKSIELTKGSIDHAAMLGAEVVVIHPGGVDVEQTINYHKVLSTLYKEGEKDSSQYKRVLDEMNSFRKKHAPNAINLIGDGLEILSDYIAQKGYQLTLGIENRAIITDMPDFKEGVLLLDRLQGCPVKFWYDLGHGMLLKELGYFDDLEENKAVRNKIAGLHIHDALGIQDHWAPYTIGDGLDHYLDVIAKNKLRVLELNARNTPDQIKAGTTMLEKKLDEKYTDWRNNSI